MAKDHVIAMFWHDALGLIALCKDEGKLVTTHIRATAAEARDPAFVKIVQRVINETWDDERPHTYQADLLCTICGHEFEDVVLADVGWTECPRCGATVHVEESE